MAVLKVNQQTKVVDTLRIPRCRLDLHSLDNSRQEREEVRRIPRQASLLQT